MTGRLIERKNDLSTEYRSISDICNQLLNLIEALVDTQLFNKKITTMGVKYNFSQLCSTYCSEVKIQATALNQVLNLVRSDQLPVIQAADLTQAVIPDLQTIKSSDVNLIIDQLIIAEGLFAEITPQIEDASAKKHIEKLQEALTNLKNEMRQGIA